MPILERMMHIDRRVIFVIIAVAVAVPFFMKWEIPLAITQPVRNVYDYVEALNEGDVVMISIDYSPSTAPELYPMTLAFLRHAYGKGLKVIGVGLWKDGVGLGEVAMTTVAEEYGYVRGEDYVFLGWKPGEEIIEPGVAVILSLGESIIELYPTDYGGEPTKDMPIFKKVKNYNDIELLMDFSSGKPGVVTWITYAWTRYQQKIAAGATAVVAASYYPYLDTGQLIGLLNGLKGAAEYEKLIDKPGKGQMGMNSQSVAHIVIILLIIMGNLSYLASKKTKAKSRLAKGGK